MEPELPQGKGQRLLLEQPRPIVLHLCIVQELLPHAQARDAVIAQLLLLRAEPVHGIRPAAHVLQELAEADAAHGARKQRGRESVLPR
jgi:hypothetical protein